MISGKVKQIGLGLLKDLQFWCNERVRKARDFCVERGKSAKSSIKVLRKV